jgi:hypothetical protein
VEDPALFALHISLDFVCCVCGHSLGATLRCEGAGLAADNPVASVKIPCPTCGGYNQVFFSPDGTLLRVERDRSYYHLPEPCQN